MIALGETNEYAAEVPFTLPLETDPLTGLLAHTFVLGEVQIKLPGGGWISVAVDHIVEKGYGRYAARLTPTQTQSLGIVYLKANVTGAQPFFGSEPIGTLGGDIPQNGSGAIPFFLPNADDPVFGSPITGAAFSAGQVRLCLPDGVYADANLGNVSEAGFGLYTLAIGTTQTAKAGKAFIYATYTGAQRFEGYANILGAGGAGGAEVPPPTPIPVPITIGMPEFNNHLAAALNRLPQQFRSGDLVITSTIELDIVLDSPMG